MPKNDKKGASAGDNSVNTEETLEKEGGDKKEIINADDKKNQDDNKPTKAEKELEDLKKDIQGKDTKISELSKQIANEKKAREEKELVGKDAKEQNEIYKKKVEGFEKKESFRQAFKDSQLNADEWDFIDSGDYNLIAKNINEIFTREKETYSNKKLEEFKASKLGEIKKDVPDPKGNSDDKTDSHLDLAERIKKQN